MIQRQSKVIGGNRGLEAGEEEGRQKDKYEQQLDHRQGRTEKRMRCIKTKIVSKTRKETKNQTEVTREMDYKREKYEGKNGVALSRQVNKSMGKADLPRLGFLIKRSMRIFQGCLCVWKNL